MLLENKEQSICITGITDLAIIQEKTEITISSIVQFKKQTELKSILSGGQR